jgi:hypothetical protein
MNNVGNVLLWTIANWLEKTTFYFSIAFCLVVINKRKNLAVWPDFVPLVIIIQNTKLLNKYFVRSDIFLLLLGFFNAECRIQNSELSFYFLLST